MLGRIVKAVRKAGEPDAPEAGGLKCVGRDDLVIGALCVATGNLVVKSKVRASPAGHAWVRGYRHNGSHYFFYDEFRIKHVVPARDVAARLADIAELPGAEGEAA